MNPEMVGIELTEMAMPFIGALLVLVITLMFKDFASQILTLSIVLRVYF